MSCASNSDFGKKFADFLISGQARVLPSMGYRRHRSNHFASGLFTTLTPTTPIAQWVGFQILTGAGRGVVLQIVGCNVSAEHIRKATDNWVL